MKKIIWIAIAVIYTVLGTGCEKRRDDSSPPPTPIGYSCNSCGGCDPIYAAGKASGSGPLIAELEAMQIEAETLPTCSEQVGRSYKRTAIEMIASLLAPRRANACTPARDFYHGYIVDKSNNRVSYESADGSSVWFVPDLATFTFLHGNEFLSDFAIDSTSIYFRGMKLEGLDRAKAKIAANKIVTDGKRSYLGAHLVELEEVCRLPGSGRFRAGNTEFRDWEIVNPGSSH